MLYVFSVNLTNDIGVLKKNTIVHCSKSYSNNIMIAAVKYIWEPMSDKVGSYFRVFEHIVDNFEIMRQVTLAFL